MEERDILELLWQRVEGAIDALALMFGRRLHAMAMNILGNREDAEECVSDTYLAVWNAIPPRAAGFPGGLRLPGGPEHRPEAAPGQHRRKALPGL